MEFKSVSIGTVDATVSVMGWPDLLPEAQNMLVIATVTVREAEKLIESCERCNPDEAEIPFDGYCIAYASRKYSNKSC